MFDMLYAGICCHVRAAKFSILVGYKACADASVCRFQMCNINHLFVVSGNRNSSDAEKKEKKKEAAIDE